MKHRLAALAMVAVCATGCGDDPDSGSDSTPTFPADASISDFCAAFESAQLGSAYDATRAAMAEFGEVGTPADISGELREGFELIVGLFADAPSKDAWQAAYNDLDHESVAQIEGFQEYIEETCHSA